VEGTVVIPIYKKGDESDCSNCRGMSLLLTAHKLLSNLLSMLTPYIDKIIDIISVNFNIADQLLIKYSTFIRHWRKKVGVQWNSTAVISRPQKGL